MENEKGKIKWKIEIGKWRMEMGNERWRWEMEIEIEKEIVLRAHFLYKHMRILIFENQAALRALFHVK